MVNEFHVGLNAAALLLALTLLIFTFIRKRTDRAQNVVFLLMLTAILINSSTEIISEFVFAYQKANPGFLVVRQITTFLYFFVHSMLALFFALYVGCVTRVITKISDRRSFVYSIPFIVSEIFVITNPFLHLVYYFDENGRFTRNWGEAVIYIAATIYMILGLVVMLHLWEGLTLRKRWSLIYFFGMVIVGLVIQLLYKDIKSELYGEALAMLGVVMTIETEDGLVEPVTGIYNRTALHADLQNYRRLTSELELIFVRITNMDNILRNSGTKDINRLTDEVSEYLKTLIHRYYIYNVDPGQFVIIKNIDVGDKGRKIMGRLFKNFETSLTTDEIIAGIRERFNEEWQIGKYSIKLDTTIIKAEFPDNLSSSDEIFFLINSFVPSNLQGKVLSGRDLDFLMRRTAVEQAVNRGLMEKGFEVYYQPTYNLSDLKLHGAEALLRLHDKELGNVFPDEFIPVVEQMGLIDEVDDYVLRCVCEFINTGVIQKYNMASINVNLSVLQCMRNGFVERITDIVKGYGVPAEYITFEITESVGADDYDKLMKVMERLREAGFRFAMDDYGTGYSNMRSVFSLNYDFIKIDKSILWGAEESELGRIILENSVKMIKEMNKRIVVEGVETEEQINMLRTLEVDFLQGFYFSKPVPKDEFIRLVEAAR